MLLEVPYVIAVARRALSIRYEGIRRKLSQTPPTTNHGDN